MATSTMLEKERSNVVTPERIQGGRIFTPLVDIIETTDKLMILADVAGTAAEDVDINFEQGELTISARVAPRQKQDTLFLVREYGVGDYLRVFRIGESIDTGRIHAGVRNGVLTIYLPKLENAKPRKIAVRAG